MTNRKSAMHDAQQRKPGGKMPVRVTKTDKGGGSRPLDPKRAERLSIDLRDDVDQARSRNTRRRSKRRQRAQSKGARRGPNKLRHHRAFCSLLQFADKRTPAKGTFAVGSLVWFPHATEGFVPAKVVEPVDSERGGQVIIIENQEACLANVSGSEALALRHMDGASVESMENMSSLPELNDASILHNLKLRFDRTPYCVVGATGEATVDTEDKRAPPSRQPQTSNRFEHGTIILMNTFETPGDAVRNYIHRVCHSLVARLVSTRRSQAVVFSGISGSGKTHFAKEFLHRMVMLRRKHRTSNLILLDALKTIYRLLDEFITAFTLRNTTSTRAVTLVELLHNTKGGKVVGARLKLFGLDASRVISRRRGEHNFAVLHHLDSYARANPEFADRIMLLTSMQSRFLADEVGDEDDARVRDHSKRRDPESKKWQRLSRLLTTEFGLSDDAVLTLARVLAAIVNLGCVEFVGPESAHLYEAAPEGTPDDATIEVADATVVHTIAKQLGIHAGLLDHTLTMKDTKSGSALLSRPRTVRQSENVRDALAKHLYKRVVTFIQVAANRALSPPHGSDMDMFFWDKVRGVKLIDMVPFEAFERSSFEHLCFNYINEGVNLEYQAFVARMQQQERLDATGETDTPPFVSAKHLHAQLRAANQKDKGVFALFTLSDSSSAGKGSRRGGVFGLINKLGRVREDKSDVDLLNRIRTRFSVHSKYIRKPKDEAVGCFSVLHYPGVVTYDASGFIRKNTMTLPTALETALWNSADYGVRELSLLREDQTLMKEDKQRARGRGERSESSLAELEPVHLLQTPSWEPTWQRMAKTPREVGTTNQQVEGSNDLHVGARESFTADDEEILKHGRHRKPATMRRRVTSGLQNLARQASTVISRSSSHSSAASEGMTDTNGLRKRRKPIAIRDLIKSFRLHVKPDGEGRLGAGATALDMLVQEYDSAFVSALRLNTSASPAVPAAADIQQLAAEESNDDDPSGHDLQFVKCIKSNRLHVARALDSEVVLTQLQKVGLRDMCRVRDALGFPIHIGFPHFVLEYACFFPGALDILANPDKVDSAQHAAVELCNHIARLKLLVPADQDTNDDAVSPAKNAQFIIGRSSVLLKVEAHRRLQQARDHALDDMATFLQKRVRGWLQRSKFARVMEDKIEHELEGAMQARDTVRLKRWLKAAKMFNTFTMTYYQAIAVLDRVYKERVVQDRLRAASESGNPKELYDSTRDAKVLRMDSGSYPELKAAQDAQSKVKVQLGDNYGAQFKGFKKDYRSVLEDLNDELASRLREVREFQEAASDPIAHDEAVALVSRSKASRLPERQSVRARDESARGGKGKTKSKVPNNTVSSRRGKPLESSKMLGVAIDSNFLKRFYERVNAFDKVKDIPFILAHFEYRMDELVEALEYKYDVTFNSDGTFAIVPEATRVETKDVGAAADDVTRTERAMPNTMGAVARFQQARNSAFVQELADAIGLAKQRVKVQFDEDGNLKPTNLERASAEGAAVNTKRIAAYEHESSYLLEQV